MSTNKSFLSFYISGECFSVTVDKVCEILEIPEIIKVPLCPPYMRGMANLRGHVVPIIDGSLKFGMEKKKDTANSSVLVLDIEIQDENLFLGLVVDQVTEVLEFGEEDFEGGPSLGNKFRSDFIEKIGNRDGKFFMILDVDKIFEKDETLFQSDLGFQPAEKE